MHDNKIDAFSRRLTKDEQAKLGYSSICDNKIFFSWERDVTLPYMTSPTISVTLLQGTVKAVRDNHVYVQIQTEF